MLTDEYTVRLEQFEGPMDLLLYLIRRAELDVTEISIASITDQYLRHLQHIERVDVEAAGEFLVTAATMLEVKSRLVSPVPAVEGEEGASGIGALARGAEEEPDNPAAELIRQLLAYKAYRDAAEALDERRVAWAQRYPLSEAASDATAFDAFLSTVNDLDIEDLQVQDLVEAFQRILESVSFDRLGSHSVTYDDTPIELHAADIMDRLARERVMSGAAALTLRAVFSGRSRGEMIGLFLATLELVRQRRLRVVQDEASGEVSLEQVEEEEAVEGAEPRT
ncbi:MAG: segregation and condensation protein A [Phycisphaerales bacterium]